MGSVDSFINAQYPYGLKVGVETSNPDYSFSSLASSIFNAIIGIGGSGPHYKTEPEARTAAKKNGWVETNQLSPGGRGKFYRDSDGNLWTRDRDGHKNGAAWKKYDRSGTTRLGTYDENFNRIGK